MNLNFYYSLYNLFSTGKIICAGVNVAKYLGIRHLLVRMDTNYLCNLRCKTCYFSNVGANKMFIPPMNLNLFKVIAQDVFSKTRILYLSCGAEPLMTKNFEQFIEVAGEYTIPYMGYVTNGLLLTEGVIRSSIENKVSEITISIDGATKETYEYIRERGNFEILLSKLTLYDDIVSKVKGSKPSLRFNFTVTRSNHEEMPLLVDLAKIFRVKVIKFRIYEDWGGSFSFKQESLLGHEKSFNESLMEAKRRALEANIQIISPKEFNLSKIDNRENNFDTLLKNDLARPPCIYPWISRYIDPLGRLRVCAKLPLSKSSIDDHYNIRDFERSKEEVERKYLLIKNPHESCFCKVCNGEPLHRANDDVNFLSDG